MSLMEEEKLKNVAYIDGANLHKATEKYLKWILDYASFRIWLSDKYKIEKAYIFIGNIPKYKNLYTHLREAGFTLKFKEVVYQGDGKPKGNCDAELLMQVNKDFYEKKINKAVIVASDGDYASLVRLLYENKKLETIFSPGPVNKCSILLKRIGAPIAYLNDQRSLLELKDETQNEKAPDKD